MNYAAGTEHVSKSFVDSAITAHKRALSLPTANKWLQRCEENLFTANPWGKSIYVLQALVDRAQTPTRITWSTWGLTDLFRMELVNAGDFSVA